MKCLNCQSEMKPGKAIEQTWLRGHKDSLSAWAGGPGKLIDCLKCAKCGWSVTIDFAVLRIGEYIE